MNKAPARRQCCSFCGTPRAEVAFLFVSHIGGLPAMICGGCVDELAGILAVSSAAKALPNGSLLVETVEP